MPIAPPSRTVYTVPVSRNALDRRLAIVAVLAAIAFVVLARSVWSRPDPAAWEQRLSQWAAHLDGGLHWAWALGSAGGFVVGLVTAAVIGTLRRRPLALAISFVAALSMVVVQAGVKPLVGREAGLVYGFPSGHALSSGFVAVALVVALWPPAGRGRVPLVAAATAGALACGAAAVSGQSHFPTDVIGSWLWLLCWSAATGWSVRRVCIGATP